MIFRPPALIVSNAIFDALNNIQNLPAEVQAQLSADNMAQIAARQMVLAFANLAAPDVLFKMLAVVGAPATAEEMHKRVAAAKEAATPPMPTGAQSAKPEGEQKP